MPEKSGLPLIRKIGREIAGGTDAAAGALAAAGVVPATVTVSERL
jgi:hypothetical protein